MEHHDIVAVMVESPKGFRQKFDYDEKEERVRLKKVLPAGLIFPFDFGIIPGTKGEDGSPLEIIIVDEHATFPGCLVDCRIVGAIVCEQTEDDGRIMRDDCFLGVPLVSQLFSEVNNLTDLPKEIIDELEHFLNNYNDQAGKHFRITARLDAPEAVQLVNIRKKDDRPDD
ncbi:inorganic diphosphatase [Mucilaginibacter agri]|uniref:inorganic diphosphatase n=1 Tax=Mucilaginibacter agri TaxID=2695265 RepID=A0A965ZC64_9SPHI|nr:inorganic diphosphatase [Mucilaginibacter agri]NCD68015.1 inorganic diphosphatase [Mucilaginibacter agri]